MTDWKRPLSVRVSCSSSNWARPESSNSSVTVWPSSIVITVSIAWPPKRSW